MLNIKDKHKRFVSVALPAASLAVLLLAVLLIKPEQTGLVVLDNPDANSSRRIDASVTLNMFDGEVLPRDAFVVVDIDGISTRISVEEFIKISGMDFNYSLGSLKAANYYGYGYTGNFSYRINLSQFPMDRDFLSGNHLLTMKIVYGKNVLSERKKNVFVG